MCAVQFLVFRSKSRTWVQQVACLARSLRYSTNAHNIEHFGSGDRKVKGGGIAQYGDTNNAPCHGVTCRDNTIILRHIAFGTNPYTSMVLCGAHRNDAYRFMIFCSLPTCALSKSVLLGSNHQMVLEFKKLAGTSFKMKSMKFVIQSANCRHSIWEILHGTLVDEIIMLWEA